jgi:hypothetical protein
MVTNMQPSETPNICCGQPTFKIEYRLLHYALFYSISVLDCATEIR